MSGYPMVIADIGSAASEATQQQVLGALEGIGLDPRSVPVRDHSEGGSKIEIGNVGLASTSNWIERSPFFTTDAQVVTLEMEVYFAGTGTGFVGPDFEFWVNENSTGTLGDTYPCMTNGVWRLSERPFYKDPRFSGDMATRFLRRIAVTPRSAIRLGVAAVPSGQGTLTVAGAKFWASGITLL